MRTIIHDLNDKDLFDISFYEDDKLVSAVKCKNACRGCFNCWIRHPKKCVYDDEYSNLTESLKQSDELLLISKCRYGCFSTYTKRVLERCIGYVLPYFTMREGSMHHISRYKNKLKLKVYFYGNIDSFDKECSYDLVKANALNLNIDDFQVYYLNDIEELKKCIH